MDGYVSKPINGREMIALVEGFAARNCQKQETPCRAAGNDLAARDCAEESPPAAIAGYVTKRADCGAATDADDETAPSAEAERRAETCLQTTAIVFDPAEALERCCNSPELVEEMIRCFFDESDKLFPQMRAALENGDLAEVGRMGHRLKGTLVYLGAQPVADAALRVEQSGRAKGGSRADVEKAVTALEQQCLALKAALRRRTPAAQPRGD